MSRYSTRSALGDVTNRGAYKVAGGKAGAPLAKASKLDLHRVAEPKRAVNVDSVDRPDVSNAQACVPYLEEIHRLYRETEGLKSASASYMSAKQTDINAKMRAILIDWLVEVHHKFKLRPETMYLTVHLIDRYLEKEAVQRNKLQLIGITAMFVASKYEEIYAPECRDFVYISDKAYTREQILSTEGNMLAKLNFQLTAPNAYVFLKRFCKVAGVLSAQRTHADLLASYLVELTLQEYDMLKYLPSTIAASAVFLALKTLGKEPWTSDLATHAGYSEAALMPCVREINRLHKAAGGAKLQAVRKKYSQEKHGAVSSYTPVDL
jgi:cyclin B